MASDSDSDADFVVYGTPLEPLEEDEARKKPIPIHDQVVKDDKGRFQRFHGAFTGGFSAGYFNTVGTKEGWTPSTFISSRQQKADKHNSRPEDFMDEEDMGEHGIAPQDITTTDNFSSRKKDVIREKAKAITSLSGPIPGDILLEDLVAPAKLSIGVQLLRQMGWKDGQGVGPRVKRKATKQKLDSIARGYGCELPHKGSEESEEGDDEDFAPENVTFAPKDVTPINFTPKVDLHGLGYRGLNPLEALVGGSRTTHINLFTMDSDRTKSLFGDNAAGQKRRGGVTGQAFGVGAMEDEDDDIYHKDTMSNYDMVLGGEEPGDGLYGWTAPKQYNKKKDSSKDVSYLGKILEGFTLASKTTEDKTIFPPPDLPRDYRPVHYFRPVVDLSTVSPIVAEALKASKGQMVQEGDSQKGRHQLDSAQRRELLGESALQGPSSVFDLLKVEDREKLAKLRGASNIPPASTSSISTKDSRAAIVSAGVAAAAAKASAQKAMSTRFQGPVEQQHEQALTAWSGPTAQAGDTFKPFEKNPSKQARYDLYISKLKQRDKDALELSLDSTMTEWERGRERDEFVRAALLYKPSSSSLSSRFTRGKTQEDGETVEVTRDQENDVDDKQAAVTMKMFGKLTRDSFEWHPDKLLCKRFNIPDPYPGSGIVGMPKVKRDKFSVFNFLNVSDSPTAAGTSASQGPPKAQVPGKRSRWDVSGQAEDEKKDPLSEFISVARTEASAVSASATTDPTAETKSPEHLSSEKKEDEEEEEIRPPMDLFKAIFAGSSDDNSSSSSDNESEDEKEQKGGGQEKAGPQISSLFNINQTPTIAVPPQAGHIQHMVTVSQKGQMVPTTVVPIQGKELEEFGPRLPPQSTLSGRCLPSSSSSVHEEKHKKKCKEKHKAKKQHKHKKEKKQKKKHKKHKHKGKQKKESDSSNASDTDSYEVKDSTEVSTEELLQRLKGIRNTKLR